MRRPILVLLICACSHASAPPAAPVTQPAPPPAAAPSIDLTSAVTAAGRDTPEHMDWGDKGEQPARTLFKNIKLLGDVSGNRFMAAMQSMEASLGKKCKMCHDPQDWASDAKDEKPTARKMMQMALEIDRQFFRGESRVTCYTCHLGHGHPPKVEQPSEDSMHKPAHPVALPAADADKPAEQVFKNIQMFKGMPAKNLLGVMGLFTADLGVECTHCHVEDNWASDDKKPKLRAREMMKLVGFIKQSYFADEEQSPVGCMSCHRGKVEPPRRAG